MSDAERRNGLERDQHGPEPLAEFPSESEPAELPNEVKFAEASQESFTHDAAGAFDEPDSRQPQDSDEAVQPSDPSVRRRWRIAELVAAGTNLTRFEPLVTRSRDALGGLVGSARPAWSACLSTSSRLVGAFRNFWTRAALQARSCAVAPPALWHDVSSRAGRALSSGSPIEGHVWPARSRSVALFLAGVVVGGVLVTAARWSFTAVTTGATSTDRLALAFGEPLSAVAPSQASTEVPDAPAGGGALHDSDSPGTPSQEEAASPPETYRGSLMISSRPRGAEVFVNGQPVGKTPLVLDNLHVGSRAVRLKLEGHESWSRAVDVVANQRASVVALLPPSRP